MNYKILFLLLIGLIFINPVNANGFINGDFESGGLTGWTYQAARISNNSYNGTYSCEGYKQLTPIKEPYIYQTINLLKVDYIEYYIKSIGDVQFKVSVDNVEYESGISLQSEGWTYHKIDMSNIYTNSEIKFSGEGLLIDDYIYFDSINTIKCSEYNYLTHHFDKTNNISVYWYNSILVITLLIIITLSVTISMILNMLAYMRRRDL